MHRLHHAAALASVAFAPAFAQTVPVTQLESVRVLGTAEEEIKESLGVSVISAEDIAKRPPATDLSEIIRREPGVNLTGNSASGNRGNSRQIDLRGMGPENTLILIDGKPVSSRNSVRYGWNGDRDTRGDTNWVPPEEVERIEVIRGPAAARYGSGAMGGVVNIITKRPTDKLSGSATYYTNQPESGDEGESHRTNFRLSGPLSDTLSFRLYGGYSKTRPDAQDINEQNTTVDQTQIAGREGFVNQDLNALLSWALTSRQTLELDAGYSRQGNRYAGDTMLNNGGGNPAFVSSLYGSETYVMYRNNVALTHRGRWDWGDSRLSLAYEGTRNARQNEGLAGGPEGAPAEGEGWFTSRLKNWRASGEVNVPFSLGFDQVATIGAEYLRESLEDPGSLRNNFWDPPAGAIPGFSRGATRKRANSYALYAEDNIEVGTRTTVTPGLRLDHHDDFGSTWSPSLNASHRITDKLTIKGGIARAYKAPNLYQANPNYLLYSRGFGCNQAEVNSGGCFLQGNADLAPETSVNKELGLAYDSGTWRASAAYFRNDYRNKIVASNQYAYQLPNGQRVLQWVNSGKAVVEGVEGNLFIPLTAALDWNTNFTYMIESKDKRTGEPLSVIPKYTVNTTLDWAVTDQWRIQGNVTWYGKQEAPGFTARRNLPIPDGNRTALSPYALAGLNTSYTVNRNLRFTVGVNNLFDKKLYRAGVADYAGAASYNEPGRSYFASATVSF
ncbi:TonB-dependent receptor; Outer membrane receptor for ferrienterochelin and colicins [plant metagenome]|uniref:TonB-dependent receptor Outer membrane receptor for ferrienterochelin and colicins n=1 Tax=plant metagenome TaxID=1297885 RepID=A0A484V1E5_9ZZZZ